MAKSFFESILGGLFGGLGSEAVEGVAGTLADAALNSMLGQTLAEAKGYASAYLATPLNHDLERSLRFAALLACLHLIREQAKIEEAEQAGHRAASADRFCPAARRWLNGQFLALGQVQEGAHDTIISQYQQALDTALASRPDARDATRAQQARAIAEQAMWDELTAALADHAMPTDFTTRFMGDGQLGWFSLFIIFTRECLKNQDNARHAFIIGGLSVLQNAVTRIEEAQARFAEEQQRQGEEQKKQTTMLERLLADVSRDKGVPIPPLQTVLRRLGQLDVPPEEIPTRLDAAVTRLLELEIILTQFENATEFSRLSYDRLSDEPVTAYSLEKREIGCVDRMQLSALREILFRDAKALEKKLTATQSVSVELDPSMRRKSSGLNWITPLIVSGGLGAVVAAVTYRRQLKKALAQPIQDAAAKAARDEARRLVQQGNFEAAATRLRDALQDPRERAKKSDVLLRQFISASAKLDAVLAAPKKARSLIDQGNFEAAATRLRYARGLARSYGAVSIEASMAANEAKLAELAIRYREAAALFAEAAALVPFDAQASWGYRLDQADVLRLQSKEFSEDSALREAITVYEQALALAPRNRVPRNWAKTQNNLGNCLAELASRSATPAAHLAAAITHMQNAVEGFREVGDGHWRSIAEKRLAELKAKRQ